MRVYFPAVAFSTSSKTFISLVIVIHLIIFILLCTLFFHWNNLFSLYTILETRHHLRKMNLLELPECMLEQIFECLSYDEIAKKRLVIMFSLSILGCHPCSIYTTRLTGVRSGSRYNITGHNFRHPIPALLKKRKNPKNKNKLRTYGMGAWLFCFCLNVMMHTLLTKISLTKGINKGQ